MDSKAAPQTKLAAADFGLHIYADYQRSLFFRGAVDFDDLIVLAFRALDADKKLLAFDCRDAGPTSWRMKRKTPACCKKCCTLTAPHSRFGRHGDPPDQAIDTT